MSDEQIRALKFYEGEVRRLIEPLRTIDPDLHELLGATLDRHTDHLRERVKAGDDVAIPEMVPLGPRVPV